MLELGFRPFPFENRRRAVPSCRSWRCTRAVEDYQLEMGIRQSGRGNLSVLDGFLTTVGVFSTCLGS